MKISTDQFAQKTIEVTDVDMPLSCPMGDMDLWDKHPRVYLPIEKTGEATCPYCSIHYVLKK